MLSTSVHRTGSSTDFRRRAANILGKPPIKYRGKRTPYFSGLKREHDTHSGGLFGGLVAAPILATTQLNSKTRLPNSNHLSGTITVSIFLEDIGRKSEKLRRILLADEKRAELFDDTATGVAELEALVKKAAKGRTGFGVMNTEHLEHREFRSMPEILIGPVIGPAAFGADTRPIRSR